LKLRENTVERDRRKKRKWKGMKRVLQGGALRKQKKGKRNGVKERHQWIRQENKRRSKRKKESYHGSSSIAKGGSLVYSCYCFDRCPTYV
jgi:hypothetical protein